MRPAITTTAAAFAAAAGAGILSMVGPQHAGAVSAFAPSTTFVGPSTHLSYPAAATTTAFSSVAEVAETEAAPQPQKPKQQQQKKKRKKSTKVTPKASSANGKAAAPKNGKRGKNGNSKRQPKRKFKSSKSALHKSKIKPEDLLPLSSLRLGQLITGYVAAITDFGAFVKTGYKLEGGGGGRGGGYALLHISQISDERVENVSDVLEIGQELKELRVTDINYARGEVGVSLRSRRPKRFPLSVVRRGEEMEGKVTSVVPYGAFVDVGCKANALLHVSRISTEEVKNVEDYVKEGDFIKVRIIDVDTDKRTLACSMLDKKADEYLDRRSLDRRKKRMERKAEKAAERVDSELQTELAYFEEALKELEDAFKE